VASTSIITRTATVAMAAAGPAAPSSRQAAVPPDRLSRSGSLGATKTAPQPAAASAVDLDRAVVQLSAGGTS
jgi:hypothetical protein